MSVYASVREQIREYIRSERLQPGDRLPSERGLSAQLGVSRTSLRQALTALRVEGLVEVRHGQGIRLIRSVDDVVPPIAAETLRAHPRVAAAGKSATPWRRSPPSSQPSAVTPTTWRRWSPGSARWTLRSAPASRGSAATACSTPRSSPRLATTCSPSSSAPSPRIGADRGGIARTPGQPARSLTAHRLIFEAISARDGEEARQLMDEHLEITGQISGDEERTDGPASRHRPIHHTHADRSNEAHDRFRTADALDQRSAGAARRHQRRPKAGGITREVFTPTYTLANDFVADLMGQAGLDVRIDAFGNLFGRLEGSDRAAPAVLTGSHIDTTLNAGAYDGVLGVLGAIEAIRALRDDRLGARAHRRGRLLRR